ncbi:MAG: hypothetical protein IJH71_09805, partial [Eubacterium sp.]|nr:hypothetical protein [Eubacterium sp.]
PPKINHDPLHNRLAGILAAFFLCPHFNLYKILKVHHFNLDFLFAGFIINLLNVFCFAVCIIPYNCHRKSTVLSADLTQ